ncbi:MAG: glycosyltransferase family 2 protein [Sedimentisphaerales bacterium]|nr:glycosyltransferase family 2 protein [Sedimentisphaerales bacterium]
MNDRPSKKTVNSGEAPAASISIFFPCYNEAGNIKPLVSKTLTTMKNVTDDIEIILVNDGSTDDTASLIDELDKEYPAVRAVHHPQNLGYGSALQTGFKSATKELVFYTDGDSQFDISELADILPLIHQYDIVSCYRINRSEGFIRKVNAWCWTKLVCFLFKLHLKDIDCAFKLYKRSIFDNIEIKSTGALIDAEILARAAKKGYTITQAGVHHYPRTTGSQTGANIAVIIRAFRELFELYKEISKEG